MAMAYQSSSSRASRTSLPGSVASSSQLSSISTSGSLTPPALGSRSSLPSPFTPSNLLSGVAHLGLVSPAGFNGNKRLAVCETPDLNPRNEASSSSKDEPMPEPKVEIVINNVMCTFNLRCHLNLREIALNGLNVEYRRERGFLTMRLRRPFCSANVRPSGKITCMGTTSEEDAKTASRRFARLIQKLGFNVRFANFRIVNVLGACHFPFGILINNFSLANREHAWYEPELNSAVTYTLKQPKATLKIHATGSVTVTAPSVANVEAAIAHIYPLLYPFRKRLEQSVERPFATSSGSRKRRWIYKDSDDESSKIKSEPDDESSKIKCEPDDYADYD